jgi:uncharacterized membrane protein YdjX (TVP38/TMEM64 family)
VNGEKRRARWLLVILCAVLLAVAVILWRFTPLAQLITPQRLSAWLGQFRSEPWTPLAIVGLFVVGGLVAFPVLLLIGATAVVLDPMIALIVSLVGTLASALVTYVVGARLVRSTAHTAFGPTLKKVSEALATRGVIAVAVIRMMPIAPFSVVNVAAGSVGVPLRDYMVGTALGIAPGLVAITVFGQQLHAVLEHPTPSRVAALVGIIVGWIALSLGVQRMVSRRHRLNGAGR